MITKKEVYGTAHVATRFELSVEHMYAIDHLRKALDSDARLNSNDNVELTIDQNDYRCLFELLTVLSDVHRTVTPGMFAGEEERDIYTPKLFKTLPKIETYIRVGNVIKEKANRVRADLAELASESLVDEYIYLLEHQHVAPIERYFGNGTAQVVKGITSVMFDSIEVIPKPEEPVSPQPIAMPTAPEPEASPEPDSMPI